MNLIRDELGEIPVYYSIDTTNNSVVHGSSVRELIDRGMSRKICKEGLWLYLSYGCVYAPYTLIEGVKSLPPGSKGVCKSGKIEIERYWHPSFATEKWTDRSAQSAVNAELLRAIRERTLEGDPAAFLSGGIDSSAIVSLWRRQYDGEIRTYCVTHEDQRTDERRWAQMVADANHTKHTELLLENQMIRKWFDEAIESYDQPSVDGLNFWFATKLLKERTGERVVLSGEGGDELFMGYGCFIKHRLAYKYAPVMRHLPNFCGSIIDSLTKSFSTNEKFRKLGMLAGFRGEPYYVPRRILSDWQIKRLLRPELLDGFSGVDNIGYQWNDDLPDDLLNRISWLEMQTVVADMWMRDGYQTSSHNGITLRTPLCDRKLAELLYTIPGEMKCHPKISKPMLVSAAGNGIPDACVYRKKQGFSLPFNMYFSGELKERIDEFLSGNTTRLFRPEVIREIGRQYREGRLYWNRMWLLFMVENWCAQNDVEL